MSALRKHNPRIESRLTTFLQANDAIGLYNYLLQLSNAEFRTAGFLLGDKLLSSLSRESYWHCFITIVPKNSKAFLGTFLKALPNHFALALKEIEEYAQVASPIDKNKLLVTLLPTLSDPQEIEWILNLYYDEDSRKRVKLLLKFNTLPIYYCIFQSLRKMDHQIQALREYSILLMRKGDHLSFNLAGIIQSYFGLNALPGTFSLRLETYELNRLETYEGFQKIITT